MDKYQVIKELFAKHGDENRAPAMAKYMRNQFMFYGISALDRKKLYKEFIKSEKSSKKVDWEFLNQCYQDDHREFQYLVYDYLLASKKFIKYEDIPKIRTFVITKSWWDTVDFLAQVIGNIAINDKRVDPLMIKWSKQENIWIKRVAILYQLRFKNYTNSIQLEKIILNCVGSDEFFINKAIGWALREYSKIDPNWVSNFLNQYQNTLDKLTIREAGKYLKSQQS
ncbi:3-methyladenine DNA glycosylase AlkD [Lactobacillus colini]|uniref:3-methyladenine DNA glycosylase AlkD n=1 Tax=Lactobacillus colini TaxID=1819254 RepID=A0ABS4MCT9_9LACO|nr:DNA alkylation repair protein [Lactobacillus colini]MBP2057502.1 3-methyladenine DNA glycosylase AlkD [Lactobacillus colini]